MKNPAHHIIFEGAELVGKSYLMSRMYDFLEEKYNKNRNILDGCHWFNSDVGIFGTKYGKPCIERYIEMLEIMKDKNVLFEKFHISDIVYNRLHRGKEISYKTIEKKLLKFNTKIIFCYIQEDIKLLKKRIRERLRLYPHYERILQNPRWYIMQQREYKKEIQKTMLPYKQIDVTHIPSPQAEKILLQWFQ